MKLLDLRKELKSLFSQHAIDDVDADFICSEVLDVSRTELVLIEEIGEDLAKEIREKANLRINGTPVEKIFKRSYFYGYEFKVDDNVLSPRPETELLVETSIKYINENGFKSCLDLCTGSGCIAISIQKKTGINVTASDISHRALQIAKFNAKNLQADVEFIKSDMFEKIENKFDLIVSNPPYIDSDEIQDLEDEVVNHDPHIALDGGEMGLKYYNIIHDNLRKHLNDGGMALLEIGEDQKDLIVSLFNDFILVETLKDYSGNDRIVVLKK